MNLIKNVYVILCFFFLISCEMEDAGISNYFKTEKGYLEASINQNRKRLSNMSKESPTIGEPYDYFAQTMSDKCAFARTSIREGNKDLVIKELEEIKSILKRIQVFQNGQSKTEFVPNRIEDLLNNSDRLLKNVDLVELQIWSIENELVDCLWSQCISNPYRINKLRPFVVNENNDGDGYNAELIFAAYDTTYYPKAWIELKQSREVKKVEFRDGIGQIIIQKNEDFNGFVLFPKSVGGMDTLKFEHQF